jgi:hypothetical protein
VTVSHPDATPYRAEPKQHIPRRHFTPADDEMTTQQAAEFIGYSRATVARLLDGGRIRRFGSTAPAGFASRR